MNVSWALPRVWPSEVYSLELGIVGTGGALTIDDTHRDVVFATEAPHESARLKEGRNVSFLTSYPPGDVAFEQLWGPHARGDALMVRQDLSGRFHAARDGEGGA